MPLNFAAETEVSQAQSRVEIEHLFSKVGAKRFGFIHDEDESQIAFEVGERRYRFRVAIPDINHPYVAQQPGGKPRPHHMREVVRERLARIRWRTLALGIKARLAEVEVGVTTMEAAFLAETLLPSGRTVAEETSATIALAYRGREVPLLPSA